MSLISGINSALRRGLARNIVSLLFMFGIIPLGVLTLIFFSFYFKGQKSGITNVQKEIAERLSSGISAYLEKTVEEIRLFTHFSDLEIQDKSGLKDLAYQFLDQGLEYETITIADLEGREICKVSRHYTFRPHELGSVALDKSFRAAVEGKTHISQIEISKFSKLPQVRIAVPMIDVREKIRGVLDVSVNVAKMWELISKYRIGGNRYAYIVDPKGALIAYQDISSVLKKTDLKHIQGVKEFLEGKIGVFEYEGLNNDSVIGANAIIPLTGWGIIVEQPVKAAYRDLYVLSSVFLCIFLLTVAFAIFLGLRFSVRNIIGPVRSLQREAQAIAKGEFGQVIEMDRPDELGDLSKSFDKMVKDLQETTVSRDLLIKQIKERECTEKALRESEKRFRDISYSMADWIWEIDNNGRYTFTSGSVKEILGYDPEELIGKTPFELMPEDEAKRIGEVFKRIVSEKRPIIDLENWNLKKKGKKICLLTNGVPLLDESGGLIGYRGVDKDITENKRIAEERVMLEAQLQKAQKMKAIGTLAGGVAHDLNNILSGIVSYPELILIDLPEDSPLRKSILTIKNSGERAAVIVQDLLTLARRGVTISEVLNLNNIVSEQLKSPEFEKLKSFNPDVQVDTHFEKDLLNIKGSTAHLSKSVMNLVSNAAEAMPDGGKILISTENRYIDRAIRGYDHVEEGDYVIVKISDTGIGISKDDMEKIFEPFYTKKVMGRSGTGLGMAVVWGTVKDHKGYIDIESTEGKGTTFTLYFPVTREEIVTDKSMLAIENYLGKGESILVVDDVEEQRELAFEMLNKLRYAVNTVSSGEEAVDYMKDNSADILVLDMIMPPGIDGLETYKRILEFHPGQKAIIASGFSETARVKEAQRLGAGKYIKKPYTLEKIGLAVREELEK